MYLTDSHIHSQFSKDSKMTAADICSTALRLGIDDICLLDHLDFDPNDYSYGWFDYEKAMAEVERLTAVHAGTLALRAGVEVSYQSEYRSEIAEYLNGKVFDFILGSVHFVKRAFLPDWIETVEAGGDDRRYRAYFEELRAVAESGLFDAIGHFDYFRRYSAHPAAIRLDDYLTEIVDIIDIMVEKNIGMEVNSSGLRHPNRSLFPGLDVLRRFRERGGTIVTIGSDAHRIPQIGFGLEEAAGHVRRAGFDSIAVFERRTPRFVKI